MGLQPKEQAAVQAALARGLSQGKIDTFISENPGDYDRLRQQQPDDKPGQSNRPAPEVGMPGGNVLPGSGAPATAPAAGLEAAAPAGNIAPQVEGGGGGEVSLPGVGMLRQDLGQRVYPSLNSPLAGLRKVY